MQAARCASGKYNRVMTQHRPWPIRWWLFGLIAAVAIPLIALLTLLYFLQMRYEIREARHRALRIAQSTASQVRAAQRDSLALLHAVAARWSTAGAGSCEWSFAVVDSSPQYVDLFFFDRSGRLACSANPTGEKAGLSAAARPWIESQLRAGRLPAGSAQTHVVNRRWLSVLPAAVKSSDGEGGGTLVLLRLPEAVWHETFPSDTVITILDHRGLVVSRSEQPERWSGRSAREFDVAKVVMRSKEGITHGVGLDGVDRQYGFTFVPELGWHIYVGVPTAVIMQPLRETYVRAAAVGVVIILLVIAAAVLLARALVTPVNALATRAAGFARGEPGPVGPVRGPREVVMLAETFDAMIGSRSEAERRLKALSDRLLEIQEDERTRIARELHDDLGQSLTALKMDVVGLLRKSTESAETQPLAERIVRTLDDTVSSLQRISSELRPSALDDLGLAAAVEAEAELFEQRTGIECEVSFGEEVELDNVCATAIYRIVQEGLTNVARHADATRVELRLRHRSPDVVLEVRDDGRGITEDERDDPSSLGLLGIRERADLLGGTVHIEGIAGRGTILRVRIPLVRNER